MDTYNPARDVTPAFIERVADWISDTGEVLVVLRYLRAAGAKDYALCRSRGDFEALVGSVPSGCDIEVFRDPQLPIRGSVTPDFITTALASIPDDRDYLVLSLETEPDGIISRYSNFDCSHAGLRAYLDQFEGHAVALGLCPDLPAADNEGLISASKGGIDGPR